MPTTVKQEIRVADLRKNDRLASGALVTNVQHKVAWSYVTFGNDIQPKRLRGTETVDVLRDVMTDEEKEANKRMFMVDGLRNHLQKLLSNTPLAEVEAAVEKYNPTYGELLTSYNLPGILKTQAMYRQGLVLRSRVAQLAERRGVDVELRVDNPNDVKLVDEDLLIDAYALWFYENTSRDHRVGPVDPTSRSTSPLSNLIEDVERWAVEKIVDELRWYVMQDVFDARVAAFTEENKRRNANG